MPVVVARIKIAKGPDEILVLNDAVRYTEGCNNVGPEGRMIEVRASIEDRNRIARAVEVRNGGVIEIVIHALTPTRSYDWEVAA
jgi:hypothetical protein